MIRKVLPRFTVVAAIGMAALVLPTVASAAPPDHAAPSAQANKKASSGKVKEDKVKEDKVKGRTSGNLVSSVVPTPGFEASPSPLPPTLQLFAACIRSTGSGTREAVFGYRNLSAASELPSHNVILKESDDGTITTVPNSPQAGLLLPSTEQYVFSVPMGMGDIVAWQVDSRVDDYLEDTPWRVTASSAGAPACDSSVPRHFAVIQDVNEIFGWDNVVLDDAGNVVSYDIVKGYGNLRVACSAGGTPSQTKAWIGWIPSLPNLTPLDDPTSYTLQVGNFTLEMSQVTKLAVLDVTKPVVSNGSTLDVIQTCAFPDGTSVDSLPFWFNTPTTVTVTPLLNADGEVTKLLFSAVAPGGVRIR